MSANPTTETAAGTKPSPIRFQLGRLFMTQGAAEAMEAAGQDPQEFINRHARLERGELCDDDYKENIFSVDKPLRIFSAFKTSRGVRLWVITEADRSATTILLPDEY